MSITCQQLPGTIITAGFKAITWFKCKNIIRDRPTFYSTQFFLFFSSIYFFIFILVLPQRTQYLMCQELLTIGMVRVNWSRKQQELTLTIERKKSNGCREVVRRKMSCLQIILAISCSYDFMAIYSGGRRRRTSRIFQRQGHCSWQTSNAKVSLRLLIQQNASCFTPLTENNE